MTSNVNIPEVFAQDGRLHIEFVEEKISGVGNFRLVTKATNKIDKKQYAIKKLLIKSILSCLFSILIGFFPDPDDLAKVIKELEIWAHLSNDHFVQYRSAWAESPNVKVGEQFICHPQLDIVSGSPVFAIYHIQMDLCTFTLDQLLTQMKAYFKIADRKQLFPPLAYYISSELLLEILEGIRYLHESMPPIMHRDVRPQNILIKPEQKGRFVKISDFGLAKMQKNQGQSNTTVMTGNKYTAPEMMTSSKYDTSVDVYSIGVMIQDMFHFDINR